MRCSNCGQDNLPEAGFCANCGTPLVSRVEQPTPVAAPSPVFPPAAAADLAGFWRRFGGSIIDAFIVVTIYILLGILIWLLSLPFMFGSGPGNRPLAYIVFTFVGRAWVVALLVPWLYYWLFIGLKGQTPGKMAVGIRVVDRRGDTPGLGRAALREVVGKTVASIPLYLGFLWIAWDGRKQGWHDKIAGTYVVYSRR